MKKKILFVVANSMIGGVEMILYLLLKNLPKDRYEKHLISTHIDGPLRDKMAMECDNYNSFTSTSLGIKREVVCQNKIDLLKDYRKDYKPDIIHIFNSFEAFEAVKGYRGRIIFSLYGDYNHKHVFFDIRNEAIAGLKATKHDVRIITDTQSNMEVYPEARLILTGVEDAEFSCEPERNPKRCVWIGRAAGEKRLQLYLDIAKKMPDYEFVVFASGWGAREEQNYQLPKNVFVFKNVTDKTLMYSIMESCGFYINTSATEGNPLALIEGMKCGCIPIVPHLGQMPEMIGEFGHTISLERKQKYTKEDVDMFRDMIIGETKNNPRLRHRIRERVKDYNIPQMVRAIEKEYW